MKVNEGEIITWDPVKGVNRVQAAVYEKSETCSLTSYPVLFITRNLLNDLIFLINLEAVMALRWFSSLKASFSVNFPHVKRETHFPVLVILFIHSDFAMNIKVA